MGLGGNICAICGANYRADVLFCPQDGAPLGGKAPPLHDPLVGAVLPGQIRIEKLIGIGAAGRVYRGTESVAERPVAVKVLHSELSQDGTVVARFHREAKVATLLAHPHVIDVFATGTLAPGGAAGGALFLVMEHIDGISLRSAFAAAGGALPLPRALRIVLQLCDAVGAAHAQGIVHRDIKPENVMLVRKGNDADFVKVLDFGMARLPAGSGPALTKAGLVFGTARYISPEGAAGYPVGPAGDVYAIATILYQALVGRTPFEGESAVEVLTKQINEAPAPLLSHAMAARVHPPIADVVMANLAKKPEERAPDARAFARALLEAARVAGFATETLVTRSGAFRDAPRVLPGAAGAAPSPALSALPGSPSAPTRQLEYGAPLAERIAAGANGTAHAPSRSNDVPPGVATKPDGHGAPVGAEAGASPATDGSLRSLPPPSRAGTRSTLAFLLGCVAGGAALAALGVYLRAEKPAEDPARDPRPAGSETHPLADAGFTQDTLFRP